MVKNIKENSESNLDKSQRDLLNLYIEIVETKGSIEFDYESPRSNEEELVA